MTSTEILGPPSTVDAPQSLHSMEALAGLPLPTKGQEAIELSNCFNAAAQKEQLSAMNANLMAMLEKRAERKDVEAVTFGGPVDRGPADGAKFMRGWQYQVTGKPAAAAVLHDFNVKRIKSGGAKGIQTEALQYITENRADDTFYVVDLANVLRMFKAWRAAMPRVLPFYAVKCHPEPAVLRLLIAMGAGFDCASKGELQMMMDMGVHPSRIIFAHPCKRACDIRFARENGVTLTTFDTESELHKMAAQFPGFRCVLRIRADDPDARVPLGLKYGADLADAPRLLQVAKDLGLQVVGVSFHVGSACKNLATFSGAIESAREIFDMAEAMGHSMELLDIGGGFTGHFDMHGNVMFGDIATTINNAVAANFPPESGVKIIAEPGRYFAETAASLLTPVYGHRDRISGEGKLSKDYWITDGLYGSFNCIIYDGQNPEYQVVRSPLLPEPEDEATTFTSTVWGPTCDSADCVYKDVQLPQLRNGDWLMFNNAGAYTVAGACDFNGIAMTAPNKLYVFSDSAVDADESSESDSAEEMTVEVVV